jgi:hypothetical protein
MRDVSRYAIRCSNPQPRFTLIACFNTLIHCRLINLAVRLKPIFDTNVFGHLEAGHIPFSDWEYLLAHRPRHGWPLSNVTALELLAGIHFGGSDWFPGAKRRVEMAQQLSRGRVLDDFRILICRRVLHIPFPSDKLAPSASLISKYLDDATTIFVKSTTDEAEALELLNDAVAQGGIPIGLIAVDKGESETQLVLQARIFPEHEQAMEGAIEYIETLLEEAGKQFEK